MGKVNVQSGHIAQVAEFLHIRRVTGNCGRNVSKCRTHSLSRYGRQAVFPRPDRVTCLIVRIDPSQEAEPTDDEVGEFERELHLHHGVDGAGEETLSESE
jgi:hypothetical protein